MTNKRPVDELSESSPPDLLTVAEATQILRLGRTTLYQQTSLFIATDGAQGDIPAKKFGRQTRILRAQLEEVLGGPITWPIPPVGGDASSDHDAALDERPTQIH